LVSQNQNEIDGLEEVIKYFKINILRKNMFSRCMVCNCDEFLIASKLDMVRLKYQGHLVPDALCFILNDHDKYSHVELSEHKCLRTWKRYAGEQKTKYGRKVCAPDNDNTIKAFQTFYICQYCSKVYWDGGHYHNLGSKFDYLFELFSDVSST
jgi:uncharacterized protein with PIN domain